MYSAAPRLDRRLLTLIARVDERQLPIAETNRRAREICAELGIPRPSYERVRQHVHDVRRRNELLRKKQETMLAIALYTKPLQAYYELDAD
jgi:hypothetical protein